MNLAFHHLGVGTKHFERTLAAYAALGYREVCNVEDEGLSVRIAFVQREGHPLIEIVAPLGDDHPLKSFIARKQLPSPYHTCYEVPDLAVAIEALRDHGFMPLHEPKPAKALNGARIQYVYGAAVGLVELVEGPVTRFSDE